MSEWTEATKYDIDLNALLKSELKETSSEKAQQELADATIAAQEIAPQRWKWY